MIEEALVLVVLSAAMVRRGRRLRSTAAMLIGMALLIPAVGHAVWWAGVPVSRGVVLAAVALQAVLVLGVLAEEAEEARVQAARRHTDRAVEEHRRTSDAARSRAYRALRAVEEHHGWH